MTPSEPENARWRLCRLAISGQTSPDSEPGRSPSGPRPTTKRNFALLMLLFSLADTGEKKGVPLLTIPTQ